MGLKQFPNLAPPSVIVFIAPILIPRIAFIPQFDQSIFKGIYSLVPSCVLVDYKER